ncbi:MAG: sulfotransferase [Ahniella sp.]|nr:sulfotransferase [Ahniella sp.]
MADPWRVPWPDRFGAFWQRSIPALGPWLADLETRMVSATTDLPAVQSPVFICGMARSGSTILLEILSRLPGFTSHRYADFPLLWTPFWWNRLRARLPAGSAEPVERAHRDRIRVTRESPEAFEEPIWAHFFPDDPSGHDVLDANTRAPEFERLFRAHIAKLLLARGAKRYVSKGNYNTLRIAYLATLFPDARFVVPIRSPAAHVASLMRQDLLYQSAPVATLGQIAARGHHEFGPLKRALRLPGQPAVSIPNGTAPAEWWLQQWMSVYRYAWACAQMPELADRVLLVPYESLAERPERGFDRLFGFLGIADQGMDRQSTLEAFVASDRTTLDAEMFGALPDAEMAQTLFVRCRKRFDEAT